MKKLLSWWRNYQKERKNKYLKDCAYRCYNVSVFCDELWLVHNDFPVCPMRMFADGDKPSDIVTTLREWYVLRNKTE